MRGFVLAAAMAAFFAVDAFADAANPLAPLDFFKGCWRGAFQNSTTVTDERCIAPMLGGAFLRDTHVIHGAPSFYAGEAIFAYDARAHRIGLTYYASDGGVERGYADGAGQGLVFPETEWVGGDGAVITIRASWTPDGPDRFISVAEFLENGHWVEHLRIIYTRAPDLSAPAQ